MNNAFANLQKSFKAAIALITLSSLAACGGGGGTPSYTIGGIVSGLTAGNAVIISNGGEQLTLSANSSFTFSRSITQGGSYAVSVTNQPTGQTCTISNGSGVVTQNITGVAVTCVNNTIGGLISGLISGSIVLTNGNDSINLTSNGTFTFPTLVNNQGSYSAAIATQPVGQTCTMTNGSGSGVSGPITSIIVSCVPNNYSISITVNGLLQGNSVVFQNNGGNNLSIGSNTTSTFTTPVAFASSYLVTILTNPTGQTCSFSSGDSSSGTVGPANLSLTYTCTVNKYTVSVAVSGMLAKTSLTLKNNGSDTLTVAGNGVSSFPVSILYQGAYSVSIYSPPVGETCVASSPSGSVPAANVVIQVSCTMNSGSGTGTSTASLTTIPVVSGSPNVVTTTLDNGNGVSGLNKTVNRLFVPVTVCTPGTSGSTANCQTLNHVIVDSGSGGLTLKKSVLSANLNLPIVTNAAGLNISVCMPYANSYSYGTSRVADVYVGGEVAQSLVLLDDVDFTAGGNGAVPSDCLGYGSESFTSSAVDGIIGVNSLGSNFPEAYTCTVTTCTSVAAYGSASTAFLQPEVPANFSQDNNGLIITVPQVSNGVSYTPLSGTIIFGIGTQSNNLIGSGSKTVLNLNSNGMFSNTFNGVTTTQSFIDSGTPFYEFADNAIPGCVTYTNFYCPTSPITLSAVNTSGSISSTVSFTVYNVEVIGYQYWSLALLGTNLSGFGSSFHNPFAWGLPFFSGRTVYTVFTGATSPFGVGPLWAY